MTGFKMIGSFKLKLHESELLDEIQRCSEFHLPDNTTYYENSHSDNLKSDKSKLPMGHSLLEELIKLIKSISEPKSTS